MEVVERRLMACPPSETSTSSKPGESLSGTTVLHPATPGVRLCLRNTCGHTQLPPASQWAYPLCPPCLEATRLKDASANAAVASPNQPRREPAVGTVPSRPGMANRPMAPPSPPNIIVVPCHFCPTRVAVPPGQPPGAPLLCKPCFERAIRDKQKRASQSPASPSGMIHRSAQRPPPLPRQVSLSNKANIRIAHSLSPVTPTFAKRPSMAIPQPPIPSSRMLHSMAPPPAPPRLHHTKSGGPISLPATPPFLHVATPSPANLPGPTSTNIDGDSDSDDLQLLYPESDDDSMGDPAPPSESTTTVDAKSTDTPAHPSTPTIPELWADELSELSSLSGPDSSIDESDSEKEPLMISIKRRRTSSSGLKIRIRIPSGFKFGQGSEPQAPAGGPPRTCGAANCTRTVEASSRWKFCAVCRSKYRKYQRKRTGVKNSRTDLDEEVEPLILHTQDAEINTAEAAAYALLPKDQSRKCSNPWCTRRIPFENEYEFKQCIKCRVRGRWNVKKRRIISKHYDRGKEHVGISTHVINEYNRLKARRRKLGLVDKTPPPEQKVADASNTKAYPTFQNKEGCLLAMRIYTEDFLRAHTLYIRTMLDRGAEGRATTPCGFAFDGQFSIVANWSVRSHKTERLVTDIRHNIESGLNLKLAVPIQPWFDAGSLVTRLFCEQPFSLPIPPSYPVLLGEAAIITAEPHANSNQLALSTDKPPDANIPGAAPPAPLESCSSASSLLASASGVENAPTSVNPSIAASAAGMPTGDLTTSSKSEASSVAAVESLPDAEMFEDDLSSPKLPRSQEPLSSKPEPPADRSVESRPQHFTSVAMINADSIAHSPERPIEPEVVADTTRLASTSELSHPPHGDTLMLPTYDFPMDDVPYEDDNSPSSSRAASPSLRQDGPLLPDGVIMDRNMFVEVEIRVSEDKNHRCIPGHRIIIRSRLVV